MVRKFLYLLVVSSCLYAAQQDQGYAFNFYSGYSKITWVNYQSSQCLYVNGEQVTCACGNTPSMVVTLNNETNVYCGNCSKTITPTPATPPAAFVMPELDEVQEQELDRRAKMHRSSKDSDHRKF